MTTWDRAGVYVVAYGNHARDCARELIRTSSKNSNGVPVCLVAEEPIGGEAVFVKSRQRDDGARWQKMSIWDLAPQEWDRIVYLDADILVRKSLEPMFRILEDGWDLVATTSPPENPTIRDGQRARFPKENRYTIQILGSDRYPQLSGGVWGFSRNERTESYMRLMHKEWSRFKERDQQAMTRALYASDVRVWVLGRAFNWFVHLNTPRDEVHVLHFATAARSWVCKHNGRSLWEDWRKRL